MWKMHWKHNLVHANGNGQVTAMTEPAVDNGGTSVSPVTSYGYTGETEYTGPDLASENLPDGSLETWTYSTLTLGNGAKYDVPDLYTDYPNGLYGGGTEETAYSYDTNYGDLIQTEQYANGSSADPSGQNTSVGGDPITTDVYSNSSNSTGIPYGLLLQRDQPRRRRDGELV